jgi:hypothetical protein
MPDDVGIISWGKGNDVDDGYCVFFVVRLLIAIACSKPSSSGDRPKALHN